MKRTIVLHPFLFSIYSVLGVYSLNSIEVPIQWVIRPLIVIIVLITIIYCIVRYFVDDAQYAGLITTLMLFWLFFGHFHRSLFEKSPFWNSSVGIILAIAMWTIPLAFIGSRWAWGKIRSKTLITSFLNITSLIVILMPLYTAGSYGIQAAWQMKRYEESQLFNKTLDIESQVSRPDIYLIILDAYGREDFLQKFYNFDNSLFIEHLKEKGFYVAEKSTSNYPQTVLSLSALLNTQYLDELTDDFRGTSSRNPINYMVQQSAVRHSLQDLGYRFVAFPSASHSTQMRDADVFFDVTAGDLTEFEGLLLSSTIANLAIDTWKLNIPVPSYDLHRKYILFSLEKLKTIADLEGPKFVFVHIMAPHPPFVLDEFGNPVQPNRPYNSGDASAFSGTDEEYIDGYVKQVRYLNSQLIDAIDEMLARSKQPPIIIIQGDHGPGNYFDLVNFDNACPMERYSILNAYYFPDQNYSELYPSITPVNSFRVIFDQYFGGELGLLGDKNFYASWFTPYVYSDVSEQVQTCVVPHR